MCYGSKAKVQFDMKVVEYGWNPIDQKTKEYYDKNKAKIEQNKTLVKDFSDCEASDEVKFKEILYDFGSRYKKGEIEDLESYFEHLDKTGCDKVLFDAGMRREEFEKLSEFIDDLLAQKQEAFDHFDWLTKFVDDIKTP